MNRYFFYKLVFINNINFKSQWFTDGSLILQMKKVLQKNCNILSDPMGKPDTVQMSQDVPIVHPIIKYSRDHFKENTAFTDGTYRVLEEQRSAYRRAKEVQFDDVVGLVNFNYLFI